MSFLWLCLSVARAEESAAQWNADVKTFFVTVHPYDHILLFVILLIFDKLLVLYRTLNLFCDTLELPPICN